MQAPFKEEMEEQLSESECSTLPAILSCNWGTYTEYTLLSVKFPFLTLQD